VLRRKLLVRLLTLAAPPVNKRSYVAASLNRESGGFARFREIEDDRVGVNSQFFHDPM